MTARLRPLLRAPGLLALLAGPCPAAAAPDGVGPRVEESATDLIRAFANAPYEDIRVRK